MSCPLAESATALSCSRQQKCQFADTLSPVLHLSTETGACSKLPPLPTACSPASRILCRGPPDSLGEAPARSRSGSSSSSGGGGSGGGGSGGGSVASGPAPPPSPPLPAALPACPRLPQAYMLVVGLAEHLARTEHAVAPAAKGLSVEPAWGSMLLAGSNGTRSCGARAGSHRPSVQPCQAGAPHRPRQRDHPLLALPPPVFSPDYLLP